MAILVDENTKVICQGITGSPGHLPHRAGDRLRHARWSAASRPGKGGETHIGLPVFNTVAEAEGRRPAPTPP